jgi:hypothetical protein
VFLSLLGLLTETRAPENTYWGAMKLPMLLPTPRRSPSVPSDAAARGSANVCPALLLAGGLLATTGCYAGLTAGGDASQGSGVASGSGGENGPDGPATDGGGDTDIAGNSGAHSLTNVPAILLGGSASVLKMGQYLNLSGSLENQNKVLTTIARAMGVDVAGYGAHPSCGPLPGVLV